MLADLAGTLTPRLPSLDASLAHRTDRSPALANVNVAAYLGALLATLFANKVLSSSGEVDLYLATIAWAAAASLAGVWMASATLRVDTVEALAVRRLIWCSCAFVGLVVVSVMIHGLQPLTISNVMRLAFVPVGIAAALPLLKHVTTVVRVVTVLVGVKCAIVLAQSFSTGAASLAARVFLRELGGYNSMAILFGVLITLRLSMAILHHVRLNLIEVVSLAFTFVVLCLTFSRGGFLALVIGLGSIVVVAWFPPGVHGRERRAARSRHARRLVPFVVGAIAGVLFIAQDQALRDRLLGFSGGNLSGRDVLWDATLDAIGSNPFFGIGFGRFTFTDPLLANVFIEGQTTYSTHSMPLQVFVDFGVIGGAVFAVIAACLLRAYLHPVVLPSLLALGAASLFADVFPVVQVSWVVGLVFVVGLAARAESRSPDPVEHPVPKPAQRSPAPRRRPIYGTAGVGLRATNQ